MMRDGARTYLAIAPVETIAWDGAEAARGVFAEAVRAWSVEGAGGAPHAFGWLSYDALRADEPGGFRDARPRADRAPRMFLARYGAVLTIDADADDDQAVTIDGDDDAARARLASAWNLAEGVRLPAVRPIDTASRVDRAQHMANVEALREAIRDGEVYLVNLARILHAPPTEPLQLAARIARSRAPLAMFFAGENCTVAGMSMELGLGWDRARGVLESRPIKGTRPRGHTAAEDDASKQSLATDPKERAENVMAVDVHRNDLGRVARVGSVTVPSLCEVETHAFVHHLVSTVRATVRDDASVRDVLDAVLPLGSVTGAPKRAAMMKIAALEPEQRGVYTGVYGSIGRDGSMRLAVAIRTAVSDVAGTHYGAGGGIVVESDPAREWEELLWKERAFAGG